MELRSDPTGLAPERLMVFELRGAVADFARAVRNVRGLELIDEEELIGDGDDKAPVAYLMVPDARALKDLEGTWRRWQSGALRHGETPWRDVFELLRGLRPWGPADRVDEDDQHVLAAEIEELADNDLVTLEIELVFRDRENDAIDFEEEVRASIAERGGQTTSRSRLKDIAYHALLVKLPVRAVRDIIAQSPLSVAGLDSVMSIRAQSLAPRIDLADSSELGPIAEVRPLGEPILALLDGVPVVKHPLLDRYLTVDDQFGLEQDALVGARVHGTAMASLIVHGDRNQQEPSLPRKIHVVPVMGRNDRFPDDRLIVDIIYTAILAMRDGQAATAPDVLIVNLSLGNPRRPFHGRMSPWAKVLDRMAYRFGILFVVSAGNVGDSFDIPAFATHSAFEDASGEKRAVETLKAIDGLKGQRRLFAPAETVNGITVGACNVDAVSVADRKRASIIVDPYPSLVMANPSSALGPGFAQAVKPDILMPGAREHLRRHGTQLKPAGASRSAGIKVAAPPLDGREDLEGYSGATSAAAALASRTCHRIHDALESVYGDAFTKLSHRQRAVLLKALLAHPAKWPENAAELIRATVGPFGRGQASKQKDNIRRFMGYGTVEAEDAVACAADRATFWATGELAPGKIATLSVPIPAAIGGQALPHSLSATLAWFTPVSPGRKSYRTVRMKLLDPADLESLSVVAHSNQPDSNQTNRGTLFMRCWSGKGAPVVVGQDMSVSLTVQRDNDLGIQEDASVPFGLAVTLTMPGVVELYEQVRQRLEIRPRAQV